MEVSAWPGLLPSYEKGVCDDVRHGLVERERLSECLAQLEQNDIESVETTVASDYHADLHHLRVGGELPNLSSGVHSIGLWSRMRFRAAFVTEPEDDAARHIRIKPGLFQVVALPH